MASSIPYMLATGLIPKILTKIQEARRPERFTQDFLETKLGFSGGSAMAAIPLLKRCGFLGADGTPTELYDRFRNADMQGTAMAQGVRIGFKELYDRNEYAHDLPKDKLTALVTEISGLEKNSRVVNAIVGTFTALKPFANFEQAAPVGEIVVPEKVPLEQTLPPKPPTPLPNNVDLRLSYTINLNLPETTNPEVFNAIFKSLKENLLN
jgi:Family of unknown function (DUF5343)